jgi:hypothetical protein
MAGAVTCVGHEPGYDTFVVADYFALAFLDSSQHRVRMTLHLVGVGTESGGQFQPERKFYDDTLNIVETGYGWRIDNPFWNWASMDAARARHWLPDSVTSVSTR